MIDRAEEKDFMEVMFIYKACVLDMNKNGLFNWNTAYPDANGVLSDIRKGDLYVYRQNNVIPAAVCINEDQPAEYLSVSWKYEPPFLVVHRLAVHPSFRNKGIAAELMIFAAGLAEERGCRSIRLDAITVNPPAMRLYAGAGYQPAGTIFFSYQKDPFMCMERQVGGT